MAKRDDQRDPNSTALNQGIPDQPSVPARAVSPLDQKRRNQQALQFRAMSFEEVQRQVQSGRLGDIKQVSSSEAGIGYRLVENKEDKAHFVDVELYVLPGWQVNPSEKWPGRYFASVYVKTAHPVAALGGGTEFIVNDGSTGIAQQLAELRVRCEQAGEDDPLIHCKKGFVRSEYTIQDDVLDDQGNVVIDPITRKAKRQPRLDPVTHQPLGKGVTYYLNTSD